MHLCVTQPRWGSWSISISKPYITCFVVMAALSQRSTYIAHFVSFSFQVLFRSPHLTNRGWRLMLLVCKVVKQLRTFLWTMISHSFDVNYVTICGMVLFGEKGVVWRGNSCSHLSFSSSLKHLMSSLALLLVCKHAACFPGRAVP